MNNSIVSVPPTTSSLGSSNIVLPKDEEPLPVNLYTNFILELEENRNKNGLAEVNFNKLKRINDNAIVRDLLHKMITGMYNSNTELLKEVNAEIETLKVELKSINIEIAESSRSLKDYTNAISTNIRKSELELNEIRKTEYQVLHLSRVLIILLVASVFPVLSYLGFLNNLVAIGLYSVVLFIIVGYSLYFLWFMINNREVNDFSKIDFSENKKRPEPTPSNERKCVPTDNEDTFSKRANEECINPVELRIPNDKMAEYLNPKCAISKNEVVI